LNTKLSLPLNRFGKVLYSKSRHINNLAETHVHTHKQSFESGPLQKSQVSNLTTSSFMSWLSQWLALKMLVSCLYPVCSFICWVNLTNRFAFYS